MHFNRARRDFEVKKIAPRPLLDFPPEEIFPLFSLDLFNLIHLLPDEAAKDLVPEVGLKGRVLHRDFLRWNELQRFDRILGVFDQMAEDPFFERVFRHFQASRPYLPALEKRVFSFPFLLSVIVPGAGQINLQCSVPVPPEDFFGKKSPLRVVASESLVIEKIGKPGLADWLEVLADRFHAVLVSDRDREVIAFDQVRTHWPVHKSQGRQDEIPTFPAIILRVPDGDELLGQTVLVLFSPVGEKAQGQGQRPRQKMEKVERVPTAFLKAVDAVRTVLPEGQVGFLFDHKIFRDRFDHERIIACGETGGTLRNVPPPLREGAGGEVRGPRASPGVNRDRTRTHHRRGNLNTFEIFRGGV